MINENISSVKRLLSPSFIGKHIEQVSISFLIILLSAFVTIFFLTGAFLFLTKDWQYYDGKLERDFRSHGQLEKPLIIWGKPEKYLARN